MTETIEEKTVEEKTVAGQVENKTARSDPYVCWANTIEGISAGTLFRIRGICGNRKSFAQCLYEVSQKDLLEMGALVYSNKGQAQRFVSQVLRARSRTPEEEMDLLGREGIRTACYDDPWYPEKLRHIYDAPYLLYYYGELPSEGRKSLAIIGSRSATSYGREQARVFARSLAANGVQIISGMARGIDGIAGRAALDVYGGSYAVLGGGPDICYPPENMPLYKDLKNHGGIISEYHPGVPPRSNFFPARNRIISALSDAVLVVEAREKSGTMITVDRALEQGKDVFALPGRLCDPTSKGCNNLLRQGASIATCPEDILEYFYGVGQDEDVAIVKARDLRNQRAAIIEKRQRAAFMEEGGRGPAAMHQMSLDEVSGGPQENGKDRWNTDITFSDEEQARKEKEENLSHLSQIEQCVLACLDKTAARGLDDILPEVRSRMKRNVAYSELVSTITRLTFKNLADEIRVGYYVAA